MARLLDDLLDVSRITRDKIIIHKKSMDLRQAARDAVEAVQSFAHQRGCPIELSLPESPVIVNGDSARLQQVHVNLLTNAIRHSNEGDSVDLTLEVVDEEARISVRDHGEGLSPETQAQVFDLFFQTNTAASRTEGGLGVGLSLVRDFVDKHNGQVSVFSEGLNKGSTFTVRLPLTDDALEPETKPALTHEGALSVVIVEDRAANRAMLREMLTLDGHQVSEAENARQGIERILENCPDLALVDIGLPDMTGYDVAEAIRNENPCPDTLMVALTGFGQQFDIEQSENAGFDRHVLKPLSLEQLGELLELARGRETIRHSKAESNGSAGDCDSSS